MPAPIMDIPAIKAQNRADLDAATTLLQSESAEDRSKGATLLTQVEARKTDLVNLDRLESLKKDSLAVAQMGNGGTTTASDDPDEPGIVVTEPVDRIPGSNFKTLPHFMKAVVAAARTGQHVKGLRFFKDEPTDGGAVEQKDMAEGVGASGGFLVPTETSPTLLAISGENSIMRSRATIIRMRRRQLTVPVLDQTGTTAGYPHWFGGMRAYWTEEAGVKTESDAAFRQINLVAHKLTCYTRISDELLDDAAISLADFLMGPMGFAGVIPWMEDYAFFRGTGAGQPRGIIGAGATIVVPRAVQADITLVDLVTMLENFLPSASGIWVASQSTISNLMQMNGPAGNPSYIWMPSARDGMPGMLLGMPIIFSEKLPRISNTSVGDIMLIDPRYYLVGDRQATTVASSIHERFIYDQTTFRAVHRVDGQPWLSAPLRYEDGTTQVSPFVVLGAKTT